MTVTGTDVAAFQTAFPFALRIDPPLIKATLERAERWVSCRVWGCRHIDGVQLLAAHWLSLDPQGGTTALEPGKKTQTSIYGNQYLEMKRIVTRGFFGGVAGGRRGCR